MILKRSSGRKPETEGVSVEAYVERLLRSDEQADDEIERLALEGLNSGEPMEITAAYWEEQHRRMVKRAEATVPK